MVGVEYPNMKGYLSPYKGERYHIRDFRDGSQVEGMNEVFNHAHSSLRNVIERTIGVWKKRWHILCDMRPFSLIKQQKIIVATTTLHNFIQMCGVEDEDFNKCDVINHIFFVKLNHIFRDNITFSIKKCGIIHILLKIHFQLKMC